MTDLKSAVPESRVVAANEAEVRADGDFVLYWMVMARRTHHSWALDRAIDWARALGKPLVVLEALRVAYPWASDRFHRFAIDAMADNAKRFAKAGVTHHPYVEPSPGAGSGLLQALAARACVVVTDEFPDFFLPRMLAAAAPRLPVRVEAIDGNGILPLRAAPKPFSHAHHFRRFLQRELRPHLTRAPVGDPLRRLDLPRLDALPAEILQRWPAASDDLLRGTPGSLAALPIDHDVTPVDFRGGPEHGRKVLSSFVDDRLDRYANGRNQPQQDAASGLSPYLHWGFVSPHQVLHDVLTREEWSPERLGEKATGKREGWWGVSANSEAFLEEFITWREVSYNTAFWINGHDQYDSLPAWALSTLKKHAGDPRPHLFSREQLELGHSYDRLWNATQGQLRAEGRIHNYLRILWGKRFLEWTRTPREAVEMMLHINNRWALDGRNPNSASGIFWCMGRYDRAWGPERPVYGTVRYVSSTNTARKVRVGDYIARYEPADAPTRVPG
ncbi:deoxyribodipyrimidine photolyase [Longimicrobium terrae]|nr:deoxyribodipyrimidine photolyase [Longimicrobium terrae]NNC29008.1 deoxyribodipyrimidine photolyase [Longimicrobium terrae]